MAFRWSNDTLIYGLLVLFIILIIAIVLLCYTQKVNKDLSSKINKTSFQEGDIGAPGDDRAYNLFE